MPTPYFLAPDAYHESSFDRQHSDVTCAVLERANIVGATCVVDVGCGAGQTLRIVEDLSRSALLIGVDPDESALKAGRARSDRAQLIRATGEWIPLAEGVASHVISRVAINYMHQENTLREIARVLKPGGKMVISFIAIGYNLHEISRPRPGGLRQWLGCCKDLVAGLILQVTGFQARRTNLLGRSVPHISPWRLRRQLRRLGCRITWADDESRFLGLPSIQWVIVQK